MYRLGSGYVVRWPWAWRWPEWAEQESTRRQYVYL